MVSSCEILLTLASSTLFFAPSAQRIFMRAWYVIHAIILPPTGSYKVLFEKRHACRRCPEARAHAAECRALTPPARHTTICRALAYGPPAPVLRLGSGAMLPCCRGLNGYFPALALPPACTRRLTPAVPPIPPPSCPSSQLICFVGCLTVASREARHRAQASGARISRHAHARAAVTCCHAASLRGVLWR